MSSYFQAIRRLKDHQFYIQQLSNQFALWKATQDQVDNPIFKAYSRATTNRLIWREQAAAPLLRKAEFYKPGIPNEPGGTFPGAPPGNTITIMINFDHEFQDRSGKNNHAIFEFTNDQLLFADGRDLDLSFAVNFNPVSNDTYDKLWIPFSNTTQIVYDTPNGFSIFTRIMPSVITPIGQTASPTPLSNRLVDFGGPRRKHADQTLYVIWWGTNHLDKSTLSSHFDQVIASDYWDGCWQYGVKPFATITHVNNTQFAIPSGDTITQADARGLVLDSEDRGIIPPITGISDSGWNFDLNKIYVVMIPNGKVTEFGAMFTTRAQRSAAHPWFNYCACHGNDTPLGPIAGYTQTQTTEQAVMHEVMHAYLSPTVAGCVSGGGWLFNEPGFCNNCQHGPPGTGCSTHLAGECKCGNRLRTLTGTNILVESYWSNMDGRCIAPGTETNWTHQPTNTGPIIRRYIFQKMDDLDNGATAAIGDDGTIYFNVKKASVEYKVKTGNAAVIVGQWADCWFVFNTATNTPSIYVNDVLYSTASTEVLSWNNTHSHFILGNRNLGASLGQFRGRMDDFRLYRGGVVDTELVENLGGNGLTITPIALEDSPEEAVFIVNRVKIDSKLTNHGVFVPADAESGDVPAPPVSFTTASFSTTSFTL